MPESPIPPQLQSIFSKFFLYPKKQAPLLACNGYELASFNRRMFAACLDSLLMLIIIAPLSNIIATYLYGPIHFDMQAIIQAGEMASTPEEQAMARAQALAATGLSERWVFEFLLQSMVLVFYSFICWAKWSATPGKMVARLKIINAADGGAITLSQISLRLFGYIISGVPLMAGFIAIALNKKRQGWHDKLAGTQVVIIPWRKEKITPQENEQ